MNIYDLLAITSVISLILFIILVAILIFAVWGLIKLAKKHPYGTLFGIIILIVLGTVGIASIAGFTEGVAAWVAAVITLAASYNEMKKGIKKSLRGK